MKNVRTYLFTGASLDLEKSGLALIIFSKMKNVSIKLKFRRSVNPEKEGSLIYQLIYERKVCRITSKYKIFNHEWDEATGQILFSSLDSSRDSQLGMIRFNVFRSGMDIF